MMVMMMTMLLVLSGLVSLRIVQAFDRIRRTPLSRLSLFTRCLPLILAALHSMQLLGAYLVLMYIVSEFTGEQGLQLV